MSKPKGRQKKTELERQLDQAIGLRIRTVREEAGLTQQQLAAKAKSSLSGVSRVEKGTDGISASRLFCFAFALGRQPGELFPDGKIFSELQRFLQH